MNSLLISVIVPIYNAEFFLKECIDSILGQTYKEFELILVDDGSEDSSGSICDEYEKSDSRVRVLHIDNCGIYQARKAGAIIAVGKYVTFLDSDDWIEREAYTYASHILSSDNEIDLLTYAYRYDRDGKIEKNLYAEGIFDKNQIKSKVIDGMMYDYKIGLRRLNPSLCTKFIRKSLYNDVVADVKDYITFGEDALVTYPCVCRAKKIGIFNRPFYHYRTNNMSCMHSFPIERVTQTIAFQKNMKQQIAKSGYIRLLEDQISAYTKSFIQAMVKEWFDIELSAMPYIFPANDISQGAKVVIYGAGIVGKAYVREWGMNHYVEVIGWVDRNYKKINRYMGVDIVSVSELKNIEYDFLIIAIFDEDVAMDIKYNLMKKYHIDAKKIYWRKPIYVGI